MLALVVAMILCVAVGAGVVGYVMVEARREGRGEFWTAEGEELIAGARRRGDKVRDRGAQLGRTAVERTRDIAAGMPDLGQDRPEDHRVADETGDVVDPGDDPGPGYRAAS